MIMARQNDGSYIKIKSITSWIQNLEEDIPEIYFGNELVFREWEIYKGTLPVLLETTKERLYHYKIYGNDGGVGIKTEQLFSEANSEGGYLDTEGSVVSPQHVNLRHTDFLALPLDTSNITVSYEGPSGTGMNAPALCFYDVAKTYLTGESYEGARTKTFTVPENARYFRTSYRSTMTAVNIVAGTTPATSDIPYGYKLPILSNDTVADIYIGDTQLAKDEYVDSSTGKIYKWADITGLSEPLCGISKYSDSLDLSTGTLTRKIKKLVLTGEENWRVTSGRMYLDALSNDYIRASGAITCICTHYVAQEQVSSAGRVNTGCVTLGSDPVNQRLYIYDTSISTTADFKAYLVTQYAAGTPVTIWYVLAESETSTVPVPSGLTGTIEGYLIQDGTPTPETPIYPTANGVKRADGTYTIENAYITPTDPPAPLPQIPTVVGKTIIEYNGEGAQPEKVELKYFGEGGYSIGNYEGLLPVTLETKGGNLVEYQIWGNTVQCGERTEQLFDASNITLGKWYTSSGDLQNQAYGAISEMNRTNEKQLTIRWHGSKPYSYSYVWFDNNGNFISRLHHGGSIGLNDEYTDTVPSNAVYYILQMSNGVSTSNPITAEQIISFQTMLNAGSTALPYVPYGYKLPILSNDTATDIYIGDTQLAKDEYVDSETGKIYKRTENLLDETWLNDDTQLSATSGLPIAYTGRIAIITPIDVSNADTVTLSYSLGTTATEYFMYSIFSGTTLIERTAGKTSGDIITVTNADTLYICLYIGGRNITVNDVQWIMLNTGSTALPYVPYLTPTDPPAPLPQIPTAAGETTISYGAAALPYTTGLDGIFEYGNIDGLTWKNSVSGENDITFDTAITDTGAEYVLPTGASGQYTSKSGEYRTAFTWYCVAKCPTTYHSAGQYMISNWNNQGVEISSGWAAYSSAGVNHLVRGVDNRDYNSQMPVTDYALIAVAGDVNGVASIYVNGVKMTDSWNFNPVSSDRANTVYLGKRASSQLSGTDIDYKFLALGTVKQTDEEILKNSEYLMKKYLGITASNFPEKVKFKYRTN